MNNTKFVLSIGCHNGTLMSRDCESREFDTFEEAYESYQTSKNEWRTFGYMVWFANIVSPDGAKTHLESNPYH